MQTYKHYIILLFSTLIVNATINGQSILSPTNYTSNVQYFDEKDGLPTKKVEMVITDKRGVTWMSTPNGLVRFDGRNFKLFSLDKGKHPNHLRFMRLIGDEIWCEHLDVNGYNTFGDISIFNTVEERLIPWETYNPPFSKDKILGFRMEAQTKSLFLRVKHKDGVALYEVNEQEQFSLKKIIPEGFYYGGNPNRVHILAKEETSFFQKIDKSGNKLQTIALDKKSIQGAFFVVKGYHQEKKTIWIYSQDKGKAHKIHQLTSSGKLTVWNYHKQLIQQLYPNTKHEILTWKLEYLPKYDAFAMAFKNTFFIIKTNGELMYLTYLEEEENAFDIVGLNDENDIFWVRNDKGLYQINLSKNLFKTALSNQNISFRSIKGNDTHIYFNSYKGIYELDKSKKTFSRFEGTAIGGWLNEKYFWYGSNPNLTALDLSTKERVQFELPNSQEVWSFYEDEQQRLWHSWFGLQAFDTKTKTVQSANYNEFSELAEHPIYHFYTKKKDNIFLCSRSGLYEWHPEKGVLARYWKGGTGQFKLPVSDIRHLYYDETDNSYWLATGNKGLVHWLPENGESEAYQLHRYHSNTVHSVYPDAYDNLWLSTDNGIIQFNKTSKRYKVYLPSDGTSSHEFNRISHFQDKDSTIYFGSINGVTIVQPKDFAEVNFEEAKTEVVILEVEQYLAESNRLENITVDFYKKQKITMQSGDRFFTLLLTLNNSKHLSDVVYQYCLKGIDESWTVAKGNELSISGIPYGNQILEIKASMANGQFTTILELPIRVLRPFYLNWWFWLMIAIVGISLTFFGIRWRTQRLQAQQVFLQKEVEKRTATIQKQAEELQALDQTKSRFFANVSHELRTPLTLILGPIKSTLKRGMLDNRDFTMLEKANRSGQQLLKLVGSILDLSKMEANRIELKEEPTLLFPFVRRLIAAFESHAQREGIRFSFNYQVEKDLQILLDKDKLEVILNNLLSNAIKFTQKGGQIDVHLKDETNQILISVKDTGRGIHPDDLSNVFNRFYQTKREEAASEGGTGIGLALSKEFVKLMKGNIWVESEWTQGSTFFVELPRNEVLGMVEMPKVELQTTKKAEIIATEKAETSTSENTENTEKLLIVEDNHALRDYLKIILEPHYSIQTAENGQVALDFLIENEQKKQPQPHLIISDVMMPEMDGFQLLTILKSRDYFRNIPVVMLTARAESKDRLQALRIGVDDYLLKPFDEEELLVRIENLLSNAEHRSNYQNETQEPATETTEQTPAISQADSEWLQQLEELLSNRIGEFNLSADVIAQALFIGRTQLFQKVKQLTGLTLNQYIKEVRLNRARDLLTDASANTSVKQVAYSVGFKDTKNFSRNFKKRFGKSPSELL